LFATLDWLEARLSKSRYLVGDTITEADWRLFPTLMRFDAVYYSLFKCNIRHVYEYPALWAYTRALYQLPGIAATCDVDEYKLHYYGSLFMVNPSGVVPKGPKLDFTSPHGRG
jgi:putative glutathione S-transferase